MAETPMSWPDVLTAAQIACNQTRGFAQILDAAQRVVDAQAAIETAERQRDAILADLAAKQKTAEKALTITNDARIAAETALAATQARLDTTIATGTQQESAQRDRLREVQEAIQGAESLRGQRISAIERDAGVRAGQLQESYNALLEKLTAERADLEQTVADLRLQAAQIIDRFKSA